MLGGPRRTAVAAGLTVAVAALATDARLRTLRQTPTSCRPSWRCACCPCCCCRRSWPSATMPSTMRAAATSAIAPSSPTAPRRFSAPSSPSPCRSRCRPTNRSPGCARHAYVAECNAAFMVALGVKDAPSPMVGTRLARSSDLVAGLHRAHPRSHSQRLPGAQHRARGARAVRPRPRAADLDDRHRRKRPRAALLGHRPRRHRDARGGERAGAARRAAARARHRDHAGRGTRAPQARERAARRSGAEPHRHEPAARRHQAQAHRSRQLSSASSRWSRCSPTPPCRRAR